MLTVDWIFHFNPICENILHYAHNRTDLQLTC